MSSRNVVGIIGAVVDAHFPRAATPEIYDALKIKNCLTLEVQQQTGDGWCAPSRWAPPTAEKRPEDIVQVDTEADSMNRSVYIESSVISYLTAWPSRDLVIAGRQAVTAEWWSHHRLRYDVYVSPLVVEEISAGDVSAAEERLRVVADIPNVSIVAEAKSLALELLASNAVPAGSIRDALHIAIAATEGIDYLVTWNFKHINNASTRTVIADVVSGSGLICPVLCSLEELMGEDDV